eukprot:759283-Hanusia_phi.AAC.1
MDRRRGGEGNKLSHHCESERLCCRPVLLAQLVHVLVRGEGGDGRAGGRGEEPDVDAEGEEECSLPGAVVVVGDDGELDPVLVLCSCPRQDRKAFEVVDIVLGVVKLCQQRANHNAVTWVLLRSEQDLGAKMPHPQNVSCSCQSSAQEEQRPEYEQERESRSGRS